MDFAFFPGVVFAWIFYLGLLTILAVASWHDLRRTLVPKWLTVPAVGLGVAANLLRGGLLGAEGRPAWVLATGGPMRGCLDGLLFALAGFGVAFVVFFLMWVLGVVGGGDVKLFAALGAWVGPKLVLVVLFVSLVFVVLIAVFRLLGNMVRGGAATALRRAAGRGATPTARANRRLISYSLPLALATALVLLGAFRYDLHLETPPPPAEARNP